MYGKGLDEISNKGNPVLDAADNTEGYATDAIDSKIDWFNWQRWKESLGESLGNFPENWEKYNKWQFGGGEFPFDIPGNFEGPHGGVVPGTLGLPSGDVAGIPFKSLRSERNQQNQDNPQNGGMNIDMNDRTGPKKKAFNLLEHFGLPDDQHFYPHQEGSFPTEGEPDYFEPDPDVGYPG